MANIVEKKIVTLGSEKWPFKDGEYTCTETPIRVSGDKGESEIILRTSSGKLLDALKPGVTVKGYMFKEKDKDARFPDTWRINALAKNNPDLVPPQGQYGGSGGHSGGSSGGSQRPATGHGGGGGYNDSAYTFDELVALFEASYEAAREIVKEVPPDVLQAATAGIYIQATKSGCKVGGNAEAAPHVSDNAAMQNKLMEIIEPVVKEADLWGRYQGSQLVADDLVALWKKCGGSAAGFAIQLSKVLDSFADGDDGAPAGGGDDSALPF